MRGLVMLSVLAVLCACPLPSAAPDGGQLVNAPDVCANPVDPVTRLLIAPVATGVTVVRKTPTHPVLDGGLP